MITKDMINRESILDLKETKCERMYCHLLVLYEYRFVFPAAVVAPLPHLVELVRQPEVSRPEEVGRRLGVPVAGEDALAVAPRTPGLRKNTNCKSRDIQYMTSNSPPAWS